MANLATPVDTATGQIENEEISLGGTTSYIKGNRQVFRRRYCHYIDTSNNEGLSTERLAFIGTTPAREFTEGASSIPYQNLGIAMTAAQYAFFTAGCNRVKVHGMGYDIKKITVLQENITTRAQASVLENTFQSRPSVLLFSDKAHQWDEVVGIAGLTAAGARTGSNSSNPRLMTALIGLPTFTANFNNDSAAGTCSFMYPGSLVDGGLPEVSFYMLNGQVELGSQRMYLEDSINPRVLGEGMKHSFEWINPKPQWHKSGSYPYNGTITTNGTTQANKGSGYWPSSRATALNTYYKGSLFDQTSDNAYDSTQATTTAGRRAGLDTKGNHDWAADLVPPYQYIKMPPVWGPTSKMNFTTELWIEYWIDLEWDSRGILNMSQNLWPANASMANNVFSSTTGMMDLRSTFGAAQGQQGVGLEEVAEVNGTTGKRWYWEEEDEETSKGRRATKRRADSTIDDELSNKID